MTGQRSSSMTIRRVATLSLVILAVVFASGAVAAPPKDAIVIGLLAEPVTMDPAQVTDLNSARITKRIFEGLVGQELGSYKLVPGLARTWDISKDGLVYTFNLRPNVTFHDGTPFNAEAVKFCFERQAGALLQNGHLPVREGLPRQRAERRGGQSADRADQAQVAADAVPPVPRAPVALHLQPRCAQEVRQGHGEEPRGHGTLQARDVGAGGEGGAHPQRSVLGRGAQGAPGHLRAHHRSASAPVRDQDG